MDTIFFFYSKRNLKEPAVEPVGLKSYMLIRVGLNVRTEEWFGLQLGMEDGVIGEKSAPSQANDSSAERWNKQVEDEVKGVENYVEKNAKKNVEKNAEKNVEKNTEKNRKKAAGEGKGGNWLLHPLRTLYQFHVLKKAARRLIKAEEERKQIAEQKKRIIAEAREARIRQTEAAIKKLADDIKELIDEPGNCRCVYEKSIRKALVEGSAGKEGGMQNSVVEGSIDNENSMYNSTVVERICEKRKWILPCIWKKYFEAEEFQGYRQRFWMEQLLPRVVWSHYVILGSCPEVFELLTEYACKMKSLRWLLPEAEYDEEFLDFAEDFYIEYGLAIELQTFETASAFRHLKLVCRQPVNIIDFTGDIYFNTSEIAEGSIWLDMLSEDEKKYRISGRNSGIRYFSLKEEWKHVQRRCKEPEI